jgi:hypothetical protein
MLAFNRGFDGLADRIQASPAAQTNYPAAISRVALIGSFSTLHKADRFPSRGRTLSFSQK